MKLRFGAGKVMSGIYLYFPDQDPFETMPPQIIDDDSIWVIGDNRTISIYGHFPIKNIMGKVVWP